MVAAMVGGRKAGTTSSQILGILDGLDCSLNAEALNQYTFHHVVTISGQ